MVTRAPFVAPASTSGTDMTDDIASLDFETKSGTDIKLGLARYMADLEFAILTLSFRLPGGALQRWRPGLPPPQGLLDHVARGGRLRGWNVMFEYGVWMKLLVPLGWPALKLEQLVDTMAMAAAQNLPQSLEKCGAALGLPDDKLKNKRGKYLIQRLCKPRKPTKHDPNRWCEDPALLEELYGYCDQDVIAEEAIAAKLRPLSDFQQKAWVVTQRINLRGVPIHLDEVGAIVEVVDAEKKRLNGELRRLTGGAVTAASKRDDLLEWCNARQPLPIDFEDDPDDDEPPAFLENLKGKTVDEVLKRTDLLPDVRRALEIRRAVCQTSTAKYPKMLKIVADDSTIKNLLVWHGAGTGRWASRGGLNVQNFARPLLGAADIAGGFDLLPLGHAAIEMLYGDLTMDLMVSMLRGALHAPEGHDFIDADYSSVENRVSAWISGQWDKVELFAKGLDEYKVFASMMYDVPYEAVTKDQRQVAKSAVLGCMFGQGAKGLVEYAKGMGVHLTLERAVDLVKLYRSEYENVRNLWWACADAALAAVRNPGIWFDAGDRLKLIVHRNFLWMRLPSGRAISWARPRIEMRKVPWTKTVVTGYDEGGEPITEEEDVYRETVTVESIETKTRIFCRHALIGSSIFQSAVQGTAADILTCGVFNTEDAGYSTILLAHDENMALVQENRGDAEEFGRLMCKQEPWYNDLPLAYEAWRGKRFRK